MTQLVACVIQRATTGTVAAIAATLVVHRRVTLVAMEVVTHLVIQGTLAVVVNRVKALTVQRPHRVEAATELVTVEITRKHVQVLIVVAVATIVKVVIALVLEVVTIVRPK